MQFSLGPALTLLSAVKELPERVDACAAAGGAAGSAGAGASASATGYDFIVQKLTTIELGQQQQREELREELRQVSARLPAADGPTSPSESERGSLLVKHCGRTQEQLPASAEPPLLSVEEHASLLSSLGEAKENAWVALVTPCLASVVAEAVPSYVLANSELIQWIHTQAEQRDFYQKPDLFVCHRAAFLSAPRPTIKTKSASSTKQADALRADTFRFGSCAWPLRTAVLCLFEGKLTIRRHHDIGEVFPKTQNLLRGTPLAATKCCLFDKQQLLLLEYTPTGLLSMQSFAWTQSGSRAALTAFLRPTLEPVWLRVLQGVSAQLRVTLPPSDSYLGHGATGFVFRVFPEGAAAADAMNAVALKISRDASHIDSLELEVRKTSDLLQQQPLPLTPRSVLPHSPSAVKLVLDVDASERLGAGFSFGPVGASVWSERRSEALWSEVLDSLVTLHRSGVVHGDPRLPNLLRVPGRTQLVWIDFREAAAAAPAVDAEPKQAFQLDFQRCAASFFRKTVSDPRLLPWMRQYVELLFLARGTPTSAPASASASAAPRRPEHTFAESMWKELSSHGLV
jgi:hypothetical protein